MHIEKYGKCRCIGEGIGIASLYPPVKALYNAGNQITTILSAENKDSLIMESEFNKYSNNFYIATNDGSKGSCGFDLNPLNGSTLFGNLFKKKRE